MLSTVVLSLIHYQASIEELAFKRMPEVGPAPDMIIDDLPTNLEYLDVSFGAAAGLRELSDDDLEEFEVEEPGSETPFAAGNVTGVVSKVGGETVKMLRVDGIRVVDNFFECLQTDEGGETPMYVLFCPRFTSSLTLTIGRARRPFDRVSTLAMSQSFFIMGTIGQGLEKSLQRKSRKCAAG